MKRILIVAMLLSGSAFGQAFTVANLTIEEVSIYADRMKSHFNKMRNLADDAIASKVRNVGIEGNETSSAEEKVSAPVMRVADERLTMQAVMALDASEPTPRDIHQETLDAVLSDAQAAVDKDPTPENIAACEAAQIEADEFRKE